MYIWGLGGLYTTIQPRDRGYFSPEGIFLPRMKNNQGRGGYIVVYSPMRPHIYNKCTTFFVSGLQRINMRSAGINLRSQGKYRYGGQFIYALPAMAGIYPYICPPWRAYIHIYARHSGHIYAIKQPYNEGYIRFRVGGLQGVKWSKIEYPVYRVCKWSIYIYIYIHILPQAQGQIVYF